MEHRLRKEEMEEQFNKEAKQGWRLIADAAVITDVSAGSEDRKYTSGGVFVCCRQQSGSSRGHRRSSGIKSQATRVELTKRG